MGRFDLTRRQEKWTIGGLAAAVATIGAFIVLRRPPPRETDLVEGTASFASQIEPGTYALTGVSWLPAGDAIPSGRRPGTPDPEGEGDAIEPVVDEAGLPPALKELEGMPISVGGR